MLSEGIIGAWIPSKSGTGQLHLDHSKYSTHLTWGNPSPGYWEASTAGWTPRTTGSTDYLAASRAIPAVVQSWSVVQWMLLKSRNNSLFPNSMDGNFAVASANTGPRLELTSTATWIFNNGSVGFTAIGCGNTLDNNLWGMYAITHDGATTATTYRQGVPTGAVQNNFSGATGAFSGTFSNVNLGRGFSSTRRVDGLLGGAVIWSRQLSASEISSIYQVGPACDWVIQRRRRVYSIPAGPAFRAAWATRATTIAGVLQ
jgi:hypothetical protein